ncbi:diguanylate cyclase (GGDEF)-like protein/PAS domain S-box-containing protein [Alkalibacillus flavidus]|uniref:Diguanylate cyclase (GGDEF)-like protein/PAS domain S-box-containing protein n=1 Tax=Alkalibacillus flavidus TaxID=546021 RepID=A0ABV2L070_9BACI
MVKPINVEQLLVEQSEVVHLMAQDEIPLNDTLNKLIETLDMTLPGVWTTLLFYDEERDVLTDGMGPSFPAKFFEEVGEVPVANGEGSCGTSAFFREPIIVENIKTDWRYAPYRKQIAEQYNLKASWSHPVITSKHQLVGTLAFYIDEAREPSEAELNVLDIFANLAAVIIEKKTSEELLKTARNVLEKTPTIIIKWSAEEGWPIEFVSQNINQFGYDAKDLMKQGMSYSSIMHPDDVLTIGSKVAYYIENDVREYEQEYRILTADDEVRWVSDRTMLEVDHYGEVVGFQGILFDITARKQVEEQAQYLANNDPLTGLANRRYFKHKFELALEEAKESNAQLGVLYLDCDNFKEINDELGHDIGDEFLQHFAKRLNNVLRDDDLIARIGGDEFNILLNDVETKEQVNRVAERILEVVFEPWELQGVLYHITVSIGVSFFPQDGSKADELIKRADQALYGAKFNGKNGVVWYESLTEE